MYVFFLDDSLLIREVLDILPIVQNVTAMAKDMKRAAKFSLLLLSSEARGLDSGATEVQYVDFAL